MRKSFFVNVTDGQIALGKFRLAWCNKDDIGWGWTLIGWGEWNAELGCIDQERPGLYITRYGDLDVIRILNFPFRWCPTE